MQRAAVVETFPRGVWMAPYSFDGVPVLIAVDSRGDVRKHVKLTEDVDPERAVYALTAMLDRLDPVLRLVRDDEPPPAPSPSAPPLPTAYQDVEDRAAYYRRLTRQTAKRIPFFR